MSKKPVFSVSGWSLALALMTMPAVAALAQNPEDEPIADAPVLSDPKETTASLVLPNVVAKSETVTIPRSVWEQLLKDVEELKKSRGEASATPPPIGLETPEATATTTESTGSSHRNYLLLPDISFVSDTKYLFSSDRRDEGRNAFDLEGEISIQGYVYPNVKYDAFIVANPGEDEKFGIEEGFLTFLGVRPGLNVQIGRKFAPFGRTGEQHPHSWMYSRQLLARQALVAGEALVGQGVNLNYTLPTGKNFFARLSLGAYSGGEEAATRFNAFAPNDRFEGGLPGGPGAGFGRFYAARLWAGTALSERDELEFGLSYARGRSEIEVLEDVDVNGNEIVGGARGKVRLSGADISFRRFLGTNKRWLARAEYFKYKPKNLPTSSADGYYGLVNYKWDRFNDLGVLLERTEFPNAPGEEEKAISLIYTRQFNERHYIRLHGTHGDRPGEDGYSELRIQFVAGLGPHTHELE